MIKPRRKTSMLVLFTISCLCAIGQESVEVADLTLKIGSLGDEELYYGFAEGDEIIFSFEEQKGKLLKEVEVIELPSQSKFMDFKTSSIDQKKIKVHKTGVYQFRFSNSSVGGKICKIHIDRIPASEALVDFDTGWEWKTLYDTTYTPYTMDSIVGYDTIRYKEVITELEKTEIVEDLIMDKTEKVHSYLNSNPSYTYLKVSLPLLENGKYKKERIVAWSYWIGVGEEASQAYAKNVEAIGNLASKAVAYFVSPLGGIAVGALTELMIPKTGEDVYYAFIQDYENVQAFLSENPFYQFDQGNGVAAYGKNDKLQKGTFYIGLHNDNNTVGIDVNVKIVVVKEMKTFHDVEYDRYKLVPQKVTLNKQKMNVAASQVRVNVGG